MAEGKQRRGRVESVVRPKEYRGEAEAWLGEADFEAEARTGHARTRLGLRGESAASRCEAEASR